MHARVETCFAAVSRGLVDCYVTQSRHREAASAAATACQQLNSGARALTLYASVVAKDPYQVRNSKLQALLAGNPRRNHAVWGLSRSASNNTNISLLHKCRHFPSSLSLSLPVPFPPFLLKFEMRVRIHKGPIYKAGQSYYSDNSFLTNPLQMAFKEESEPKRYFHEIIKVNFVHHSIISGGKLRRRSRCQMRNILCTCLAECRGPGHVQLGAYLILD